MSDPDTSDGGSGSDKKTVRTAPYDPRFASTVDQGKHCWTLYNEYLKCGRKKGVKHPKCQELVQNAFSICTTEQLNLWYECRRDDRWWGYPFLLQPEELRDGDTIIQRERKNQHGDGHGDGHGGEKHH